MTHAVLTLLVLATAAAAGAQPLDCATAKTAADTMVCRDAVLRELHEHLVRYDAAGRRAVDTAASCLDVDTNRWRASVRDVCREAQCLRTAYFNRLAELHGLQPGATAIRNMTLPAVPTLVWIVPPASDNVAAPPRPQGKPMEVTGSVVNEIVDGDGFTIVTPDGVHVPMVLLMFLEAKTQEVLTALAKQKGSYRVRGYAATDGRRRYFEPSQCVFVYRVR